MTTSKTDLSALEAHPDLLAEAVERAKAREALATQAAIRVEQFAKLAAILGDAGARAAQAAAEHAAAAETRRLEDEEAEARSLVARREEAARDAADRADFSRKKAVEVAGIKARMHEGLGQFVQATRELFGVIEDHDAVESTAQIIGPFCRQLNLSMLVDAARVWI